jgi:hypothetical protein
MSVVAATETFAGNLAMSHSYCKRSFPGRALVGDFRPKGEVQDFCLDGGKVLRTFSHCASCGHTLQLSGFSLSSNISNGGNNRKSITRAMLRAVAVRIPMSTLSLKLEKDSTRKPATRVSVVT